MGERKWPENGEYFPTSKKIGRVLPNRAVPTPAHEQAWAGVKVLGWGSRGGHQACLGVMAIIDETPVICAGNTAGADKST